MKKIEEKKLTQTKAAKQINISDRQLRRLWKRYKKQGEEGLVSRKRGKPSNRKINTKTLNRAQKLILEKYRDFGPTLATEKLAELHKIKLSIETVRKLMIEAEIWVPRKAKKAKIHQRRPRRSCEGELVQIDGSPHDWFEGRADKCTLLVAIDDATSKLKALKFAPAETTESYYQLLKEYIEKHGRPQALYSDRHSIFRVNQKTVEGTKATQLGRALKKLDIQLICANSPQAKGRVERANGVLQDRLIKEMRLKKISSLEEANKYAQTYIEKHNAKFSVKAASKENVHRKTAPEHSLDEILTNHETRKLSKNLTFQYANTIYQIKTDKDGRSLRNAQVNIIGSKEKGIKIKYREQELNYSTHIEEEKQGEVSNGKDLDQLIKRRKKPSKHHAWR